MNTFNHLPSPRLFMFWSQHTFVTLVNVCFGENDNVAIDPVSNAVIM